MNEIDYKNLLSIYQQKSGDLFVQNIALESRILTYNQIVDTLTKKVNELNNEVELLKSPKPKKSISSKSETWEE